MVDNTAMPKVTDQSAVLARKHVAILAFPFASHFPPLIAMVTHLSASAPSAITFSFFSTKTSLAANKFPDGSGRVAVRTWPVDDGLPDGYKPPPHNPIEPVELFLKTVPGNFVKAVKVAEEETGCKISCLVTDAFYWFGSDMARECGGVPWVPVWTSGPRPLLSHLYTDLIRSTLGSSARPGWEEKCIDFIPGLELIRAVDLPREVTVPEPGSNFRSMMDKMGAFLPKAAAVVLNSFHEVDPKMSDQLAIHLKTKVLNVGPLILSAASSSQPSPDIHGCVSWLDKQNPNSVVYISFGSVITPPPHELVALAQALEETQIPYLWSFRGSVEDKLPRDFVTRTMEKMSRIVPWAPQLEVLKHKSVGAFVTHGGWNSMMESIIGGVPMIVRPFFGDQPLNSRTVEVVWRIGLGIEGGVLRKAATVAALQRVLFGEEGKQMKERIGVLNNLAYSAVEQKSGSSTKNFNSLSDIIITN